MGQFGSKRWRTLAVAGIGSAVLGSALAACSSNSGEAISNGKNCKHIAFLLPESATAARWEAADHPDVVAAIQSSLPGSTVDVQNAQGNATTQQTQAETELSKGACILVVAPFDSTASAAIVSKAK